jgi:hypothetical protein
MGRDARQRAGEVIAHLTAHAGATVTVTPESEAAIPSGAPEPVVRTITDAGPSSSRATASTWEERSWERY